MRKEVLINIKDTKKNLQMSFVNKHLQKIYNGWGTVIRTQEWWSQSPLPYRLAIPQYKSQIYTITNFYICP